VGCSRPLRKQSFGDPVRALRRASSLGIGPAIKSGLRRAGPLNTSRHIGLALAIALAVALVCFVATDFAAGGSIGAYTSRGAYTFVSAPTLHPPIVQADLRQSGRLAKGYVFLANFHDPSNPATMVGQSGPLILDQRLAPVWFHPVPEHDLAGNLSLQTYQGRLALAWWEGAINDDGVTRAGSTSSSTSTTAWWRGCAVPTVGCSLSTRSRSAATTLG
jgi:hypothetical protein